MPDLQTRYLGLDLQTPLIIGASPVNASADQAVGLAQAGAGAIVLPSLWEEQIDRERWEQTRAWWSVVEIASPSHAAAADLDPYNWGAGEYLRLVQRISSRTPVPVIASLSCRTPTGWQDHLQPLADAGAQAIELNLYAFEADPHLHPDAIERAYVDAVSDATRAVSVPVSVKLSAEFTAIGHTIREISAAGARGVVLFNRRQVIDVDIETSTVRHQLAESTSGTLGAALRAVWALSAMVSCDLVVTGGVRTGEQAAMAIAVGACAVQVASAVLAGGADAVQRIITEIDAATARAGVTRISDLVGQAALAADADRVTIDRLGYIGGMLGRAGIPGGETVRERRG